MTLHLQKITSREFERLVQTLPNPVVGREGSNKVLIVGSRKYMAPLASVGGAR